MRLYDNIHYMYMNIRAQNCLFGGEMKQMKKNDVIIIIINVV